MTELKKSLVNFREEEHEYWLGDRRLHGITGMIGSQLFSQKYDGVSPSVMEQAKERGHRIHATLEMLEKTGINTGSPAENYYVYATVKNHLVSLAQEYTVSDYDYFATNIDNVLEQEETGNIYLLDYKTTCTLDKHYLSWQLSINKKLFLLQNPHLSDRKFILCALWVKERDTQDDSEFDFVIIDEIESGNVDELMACEKEGRQYNNPLVITDESQLVVPNTTLKYIAAIEEQIASLTKERELIHETIKRAMEEKHIKSIDLQDIKISYVEPRETFRFDSKKFKLEHPADFDKYVVKSQVKPSIRITLR